MVSMRKLTTGAVAAAVLVTSATPAFAGWGNGGYGGYNGYDGYGGHHHRHHDHVDGGDVVAGVIVVGILAAILASSSKKKHDRDGGYNAPRGNITSEDAAVDACAIATEAQAGQRASVRDITQVDRNADGFEVEGVVEQRAGWRNNRDTERRRFTCSVRYGAVDHVYIDTDSIAYR